MIDYIYGLLGVFGSILLGYLLTLVRERVTEERYRNVVTRALSAVGLAVGEVAATFVAGLKAGASDGKLSISDALRARDLAVCKAREYLGPKGLRAVRDVLGLASDESFDRWLVALIEREVSRLKDRGPL